MCAEGNSINISREHVKAYIDGLRGSVFSGKYRIAMNREKNRRLDTEYIIHEGIKKQILLSLQVQDFSNAQMNEHPGREYEMVYIFGKGAELLRRFGEAKEKVDLYIKINKLQDDYVIVISFHKQLYPLYYPFL